MIDSSKSGNYDSYRNSSKPDSKSSKSKIEQDDCPRRLETIRLEDVATSPYFTNKNSLPVTNTQVRIRSRLHNNRIVVETFDTHEIIGNIPTSYSFLLNCIKKGMNYNGYVVNSGTSPMEFIVVTLNG